MQNTIAFVFPGQGSQSLGMLAEHFAEYPDMKRTFAEASEAVGYDVLELISTGPEEKLSQTEYTQVAMLTADVALYRLYQERTAGRISVMAGHSLGEYAALVASNALRFSDAVKLVSMRGKLMQSEVPLGQGAMAALVGLDDAVVQQISNEASANGIEVSPANYNAPGQIVIAGHSEAVTKAITLAEAAGARMAVRIPVSVPCHCRLLTAAAQKFEAVLSQTDFKTPDTIVLSNVDAKAYQSPEHIREQLKIQLYSPVQWVKTIEQFKTFEPALVCECGPGRVLTGLIKRIDRTLKTVALSDISAVIE